MSNYTSDSSSNMINSDDKQTDFLDEYYHNPNNNNSQIINRSNSKTNEKEISNSIDNIKENESKYSNKNKQSKMNKKVIKIIKNEFIITLIIALVIFSSSFLFKKGDFTLYLPKVTEGDINILIPSNKKYNIADLIRKFSFFIILVKLSSSLLKFLSTLAIYKISTLVKHFDSNFIDHSISLIHPLNIAYYLRSSHDTFSLFIFLISIYIYFYKNNNNNYLLLGSLSIGDFISTCIVICGVIVIKSIIMGLLKREYSKERGMKDKIAQHLLLKSLTKQKLESYIDLSNKSQKSIRNPSIISSTHIIDSDNNQIIKNKKVEKSSLILSEDKFYFNILSCGKLSEHTNFRGNVENIKISEKSDSNRCLQNNKAKFIYNTTYDNIENDIMLYNQKKERINNTNRKEVEDLKREELYLEFKKRDSVIIIPDELKEDDSQTTNQDILLDISSDQQISEEDNESSIEIEIEEKGKEKKDTLIRKHLFNTNCYYFRTLNNKYKIEINFDIKKEDINENTFPLLHQLKILRQEKIETPIDLTVYETTLLSGEFRNIYNNNYKSYTTEIKKVNKANKLANKIERLMNLSNCNNLEDLIAVKTASILINSKVHGHYPIKSPSFETNLRNNCKFCRNMEVEVTNNNKCLDLYSLLTWWTSEYGNTRKDQLRNSIYEFINRYENKIRSSDNMTEALRRLDGFLWFLISIYFLAILFWKLFVDAKESFLEILTAVLGSSFIISSPAKRGIDCLIFLFCIHPYDVGDRILINLNSSYKGATSAPANSSLHEGLENLIVKKLNIFSTIFEKFDGTELIVYNNLLMNKYILNVGRSDHLLEIHYLQVTSNTSFYLLNELKIKIKEFLKNEKNFNEFCMFNYEKIESNKLFIKVFIDYKENCQDYILYLRSRNKFIKYLNEVVNELGISYKENLQHIIINK